MFKKCIIFLCLLLLFSTQISYCEDGLKSYSISFKPEGNISDNDFLIVLSMVEVRLAHTGAITSINIRDHQVDMIIKTDLTPDRLKFIISKKGLFSVEDEKGNKTDLDIMDCSIVKGGYSPAIFIRLSHECAGILEKITEENIQKPLALCIDGEVVSKPIVQTKISEGEFQITFGGDNNPEVRDTALVLMAGPLPSGISIIKIEEIK